MGAGIHVGRKEETRMKSNGRGRRVNGKTPRCGRRKEKAMDTNTGGSHGRRPRGNWGEGPPTNLRWGRPMHPSPQYFEKDARESMNRVKKRCHKGILL